MREREREREKEREREGKSEKNAERRVPVAKKIVQFE